MPKFIIDYNGEFEIIEVKDHAAAENVAFERWLESADQDYGVKPYSPQLAKEYGLDEEEDEDAVSDSGC